MTDTLASAATGMLAEVRDGLARPQKELPPKYFYDERGSELFEEITRLPEYYLTRTERALLERWMPAWIGRLRPRALVELGAGSAEKTRIVLDAMVTAVGAAAYVPVDVSADFLEATAVRLGAHYPTVDVLPVVADMTAAFALPNGLAGPTLHAFLGSTIGNFAPDDAVALLRGVRGRMRPDDGFLMGVDLRKDPAVIEAAYNDAAGVTAEFNRNVLHVLNRELHADLQVDGFAHVVLWDAEREWIEMRLRAERPMAVTVRDLGLVVEFAAGEEMRTEISAKFRLDGLSAELTAARLRPERTWVDPQERFALTLAVAG
jgi:L-histidine Nalpha-methyltransferase